MRDSITARFVSAALLIALLLSSAPGVALAKTNEAAQISLLTTLVETLHSLVTKLSSQIAMVPRTALMAQVVGATSLVGAYNFDEGAGGVVIDQSGNGHNGSVVGTPTWSTGKNGGGLKYGDGDNVDLGSSLPIQGISQLTLSAWMKRSSPNATVEIGRQTGGGGNTVAIEMWNDGLVYFGISPGDSYAAGSITLNDTNWHHVTLVFDGTKTDNAHRLIGYVDGVEKTLSYTGTVPAQTTTEINPFGIGFLTGAFSDGQIDDVRVYTRALSSTEVTTDMNTPVAGLSSAIPPPTEPPVPPPQDITAPTTPTGLTATAVSLSAINLTWTASTDAVGVTGYHVERCQGSSCTTFAQIGTPTTNSYADTGLTASTQYSYRVRATDAAGNVSGYSSTGSATTQAGGTSSTITAVSCSASDVQSALNSVTGATTRVNIPSGVCRWTQQVSFTVPSGNTDLSLLGAGNFNTIGGGDVTVIIDDYANDRPILEISTGVSASKFRLAGLTIQGGNVGSNIKWNGVMNVSGNSQNVRIDHFHYNTNTYSPLNNGTGLVFNGAVYGVVDNSIFDAPSSSVSNLTRQYQGNQFADASGQGNGSWAADTMLGSARFIYFEDNVFNGGIANDCTVGGRFVFRNNTINSSGLQTHPTGGGGPDGRGCRAWEIYQNTFTASNASPSFNVFFLSAGTGVVWGNTSPSGYQHFVTLHSMRKNNSTYPESPAPQGWGYCGTEFNGTGSPWDQNTDTVSGYACIDQPGRGKGDLLTGFAPNKINNRTGNISWPNQALEPVYIWNNSYSGAPGYANLLVNVYEPSVEVQNRDFYVGIPSFSGTSGVGSGLLSARPSTCTSGVAYWAVDMNVLYKCTATNSWTSLYTPYTYPHPLRGGITPLVDITAPTTPTGLTATAVSLSAINLTWTASTDSVGVTGYKIYRGGAQIGTSATNSYSDTGLTASTTYTYIVSAYDAAGNNSAQSGSAGATTGAGVTPPPTTLPTVTLTASPTSITTGASATLSWGSTNSTSCSASNGWSGTKAISGTQSVAPSVTTTYILTCTGAGGSAVANTSVTVSAVVSPPSPPTSSKFSLNDRIQVSLGSVNVRATANVSGTLLGAQNTSALGTVVGGPVSQGGYNWWNINYDTGVDGWNVEDYVEKYVAPTQVGKFSIGDLVYVTSGPLRVRSKPSGSRRGSQKTNAQGVVVGGPTLYGGNYWWNINYASGADGWSSEVYLAKVMVTPPPTTLPTVTLTASPTSITTGASATLSWGSTNSTSCSASNGWSGTKAISGTQSVAPSVTTTYILTCTGAGGSAVANTSVTVSAVVSPPSPPIDTTAPSTPTNLSATTVSSSAVNLSWSASTDNVGVTGYKIYRAGTQVGTSLSLSYADIGLTASTAYSYTVSAYDAAGNSSGQSVSASVTTVAGGAGIACDQVTLQGAINNAVSGATITCNPGTWTWAGGVTIPNTKGITLSGNSTTINGALTLNQSLTTSSRVTGFTFTATNAVNTSGTKSSAPFRVDHNIFIVSIGGATLLNTSGNAPGLIDHNSFNAPSNSEMIHQLGMGSSDASGWADDIVPGGWSAVYIENNTFTNNDPPLATANPAYFWGNSAVQSYYGARTVFRYNSLVMSQFDQHGTPGMTGARWWEVYENTFNVVPNGDQDKAISMRAGSGVIFNNHKTGRTNYKADIHLVEEDSGYPALYQIGRGKNQVLDPAYVWGNDSSMPVNSDSANVVVNRDYYLSAKPGYTPFTYPYPLTSSGLPNPGSSASPPTSSKFSLNDRIQVSLGSVNVRATANVSGTLLGAQNTSALGTVVGGPVSQGGYNWWNINYDTGVDGWNVEDYVEKYVAPISGGGTTVNATSCAQSAVQSAINAVGAGGTVIVPVGACSWSGGLSITGITLKGSGKGANGTVITSGHITLTKHATNYTRLSGFRFTGTDPHIIVNGLPGAKPFVIDNDYINATVSGLAVELRVNGGLFHHNDVTATNADGADNFKIFTSEDWSQPPTFGMADITGERNTYFEDNVYTNMNEVTLDGDMGSRVVIRRNTYYDSGITFHGGAPSDSSPNGGVRQFEVYNNTFHRVSNSIPINKWVWVRGSSGVIANNVMDRADSPDGSSYPNKSEIRLTLACTSPYPMQYQVGQSTVSPENLPSRPLLIFGNSGAGTTDSDFITIGSSDTAGGSCATPANYIKSGRDYMTSNTWGWVPYTYPHPLQNL